MAVPKGLEARKAFLTERTIRFFDRYGDELNSISQLLKIQLEQLSLAYTLEHNLPRPAVEVRTRVKTMRSFLNKLAKKNWPEFYYPTEVATDLLGARIICWFVDDCYGLLDYIKSSKSLRVKPRSLEDYIKEPKPSGYRSIHLLVDVPYDRVGTRRNKRTIVPGEMVCEVQLRTKLQDAWGEFTHEVHYKVPDRFEKDYETIVAEIANRLAAEDRSAMAVRNLLLKEVGKKKHEGIKAS